MKYIIYRERVSRGIDALFIAWDKKSIQVHILYGFGVNVNVAVSFCLSNIIRRRIELDKNCIFERKGETTIIVFNTMMLWIIEYVFRY